MSASLPSVSMTTPIAVSFPILPMQVRPITYQSGDNTFSEWITLFTLCLAPLVVHVIAGVPQVSCLHKQRPRWHDRISHYNPISILWRYAAITDRRIRAQSWEPMDLAASNTLFWTAKGWEGSESMVETSLSFCSRLPDNTRVSIFSGAMLKTIIVTLQGCQVVFLTMAVFKPSNLNDGLPSASRIGLDTIFFPIALAGLLRVFSCLWLTDDFSYSDVPSPQHANISWNMDNRSLSSRSFTNHSTTDPCIVSGEMNRRWSIDIVQKIYHPGSSARPGNHPGYLATENWKKHSPKSRYRPTNTWPSRLFRLFFLTLILKFWVMSILLAIWSADLTATSFLALIFYQILSGSSTIIYALYFIRGKTTTTIIPCISSLWYKVLTGVVFLFAVSLFVLGCIETRKTPCGNYTSYPGYMGDLMACIKTDLLPIQMGSTTPLTESLPALGISPLEIPRGFAIGFHADDLLRNTNEFMMVNFTGTCLGNLSTLSARMARFS